jgi:hypothetical protein
MPPPPQQQQPKSTPLQGEESWGRWSRAGPSVSLELQVDEGVRVKDIRVEIEEGWLLAGVDSEDAPPPFIFGRFAQPVEATSLMWTVDEVADDQRVLCIEISKREVPLRAGAGATIDCIFDESLHIHGAPCLSVPGLSSGTITIQMPPSCPCADEDIIDAEAA